MENTIRDNRVDPEELTESRDRYARRIDRDRGRAREALAVTPRTGPTSGESEAHDLCDFHFTLFGLDYTRGIPVSDLASAIDDWHADFVLALQVRERVAGGEPGFLDWLAEMDLLFATVELAFVSTCIGRMDIATAVLEHPAVAAVPSRVLDALAAIHGIDRPLSDGDNLDVVHGPWLKVASASAGRRQAAFERFVRGWRRHGEKTRALPRVNKYFTGAWAFEAVLLAQVFDLDDSPVRDVREYPTDLADYARNAGLPHVVASVKMPGPWKKPTPPKVIEPDDLRKPITVAGTVTRADIAALLTPIGETTLDASSDDVLLDAAVETGTALIIDWHGIDPEDTGSLLQHACRKLGIPAPGRIPGKATLPLVKGVKKFDDWLTATGARLVVFDTDTDDLVIAPVLAADHSTFADSDSDSDSIRLLTTGQFAANQARDGN